MKNLSLLTLLAILLTSCAPASTPTPVSAATDVPLPTATFTSEPTFTPEPTATATPRPTSTQIPIPWQSYKFTYSTNIGGVGKLWMAMPQEWDGIGISDLAIIDIDPKPDDIYQDNQGNTIAFWNAGNYGTRNYSITFTAKLAPIRYAVNPENVGAYDKTSVEYQRYTQPSMRIESDNEQIVQQAMKIVGNETNPYKQARLIHQWVSTNVKGGGRDIVETALTSLNDRSAGCGGHSFLFVALLRSLGIPARNVSGLHTAYQGSFSNGSFWSRTLYTHVWAEFYIPNYGWIQSDTSGGGQNFASINEPRIILSRGDDIELGHNHPLKTPWFHIPHTNQITPSDPKTQNPGNELTLTVEKLP